MITETEEVSRVYYPIYLRNLHQYRTSPDNDYDGGWWFRVSTPVYEDYSWFDIPTTSIMETRDGQVLVRANTIYLNRGMVSIETPPEEKKPSALSFLMPTISPKFKKTTKTKIAPLVLFRQK